MFRGGEENDVKIEMMKIEMTKIEMTKIEMMKIEITIMEFMSHGNRVDVDDVDDISMGMI